MYERLLAFLYVLCNRWLYLYTVTNVYDSNRTKLLKSLGLIRKRKLII